MKTKILTIILFATIAANCFSQSKLVDFDYGRIENSTYLNSYFNFEIAIPADWIVQNKEQMESLKKAGTDLVVGDNTNLKAAFKATEINSANLLFVYQYERGAAVEYNPSFLMVAENIKDFPGIKTGSDYLFQARRLMEQAQIKYDYLDTEFVKESIDGVDFYKMNAEIVYMGIGIKQIYYASILKGFSLTVIISFTNDEQKNNLLTAINSMKFNK